MNAVIWTFERDQEGPAYVAGLDAAGRAVLLDVVDDVLRLLDGDGARTGQGPDHPLDRVRLNAPPVEPPVDPALRRLLPDASRDEALAAELRRLTEPEVRDAKVSNLARLRAAVQDARPNVVVLPSEAAQVAAALTDLRLVVSERLGVRTDADAEAVYRLAAEDLVDEDDAPAADRRFLAAVYAVLTLMQESLVGLLLEELPEAEGEGRTAGTL